MVDSHKSDAAEVDIRGLRKGVHTFSNHPHPPQHPTSSPAEILIGRSDLKPAEHDTPACPFRVYPMAPTKSSRLIRLPSRHLHHPFLMPIHESKPNQTIQHARLRHSLHRFSHRESADPRKSPSLPLLIYNFPPRRMFILSGRLTSSPRENPRRIEPLIVYVTTFVP